MLSSQYLFIFITYNPSFKNINVFKKINAYFLYNYNAKVLFVYVYDKKKYI